MSFWSSPVALTPAGLVGADIAAAGATLHLVYLDGANLQYRRSADQGATWTAAVTIAASDELPLSHVVDASGNDVIVIYARADTLYARRSTDGGLNWSGEIGPITTSPSTAFFRASIARSGSILHLFVARQDNATLVSDRLSYYRSTDGGATWSAEAQPFPSTNNPRRPWASVNGDTVHVVWIDARNGNTNSKTGEIYRGRSTDGGLNWVESRVTTTTGGNVSTGNVHAAGTTVLVSYSDPTDAGEILVLRSTDDGATFGAARQLTVTGNTTEHQWTTGRGSDVALVYCDAQTGVLQVRSRLSRDAGKTWQRERRVWAQTTIQQTPRVDVSTDYVAIVYQDSANTMTFARARRDLADIKGARNFNVADAAIRLDRPDLLDFERTQAFSIGAWIRVPSNAGGAIFGKMEGAGNFRGYALSLETNLGPTPELGLYNVFGSNRLRRFGSDQAVPLNAWTSVVGTYAGTSAVSGAKVYVNGAETGTGAKSNADVDTLSATVLNNVSPQIGSVGGAGVAVLDFTGWIAYLAVWSAELTAAQALAYHNGGDLPRQDVLRAFHRLDGGWSPEPDDSGDGDGTVALAVFDSWIGPPAVTYSPLAFPVAQLLKARLGWLDPDLRPVGWF